MIDNIIHGNNVQKRNMTSRHDNKYKNLQNKQMNKQTKFPKNKIMQNER